VKTIGNYVMGVPAVSVLLIAALGFLGLISLYPIIRIINRTGYSRWWVLLFFVPIGNVVGLWCFAFGRWPAVRRQPGQSSSTPPPVSPSPPADDWRIHEVFRARIVLEENLIHYRMSWMLWSHAILLTLWGGLVNFQLNKCPTNAGVQILMFGLSILGVILASGSFWSIWAAKKEIRRAQNIYTTHYKSVANNEKIPSLTGADRYHRWGHGVDFLEPILLVGVWIALGVYVAHECGFL
jgi:hypothetical protein